MKLKFVLLCCLAMTFSSVSPIFGGSHGDQCSVVEDCEGFLECLNYRCLCRVGTVFIGQDCYILACEDCQEHVEGEQECAPHSVCEGQPGTQKCICDAENGFTPNKDLRCYLPYSASCQEFPNECDPVAFLTCSSSEAQCQCQNPTTSYYSPHRNECVLFAGAKCNTAEHSIKCTDNAECLTGQCQCTGDYEASGDGKCVLPSLGYGDPCFHGSQDYCDKAAYLECGQDNLCSCQNPNSTVYNPTSARCHIRAESSCIPNSQPCTENSDCEEDSSNPVCKCRADLGFTSNHLGNCVKTWEAACNPSDDQCNTEEFLECDADTLKCACSDKNNTWFDETSGSCKLLAGAECSIAADAQQCVDKASCSSAPDDLTYTCTCKGSREANKFRQCYFPFEATCDEILDECDPDAFLHCNSTNKCACKQSDMLYNPDMLECQVKPDGNCELISEGNPACVPNAYCGLNQVCTCKTNYEETKQSQCLLTHNSTCKIDADECNTDNHFICKNGRCDCAEGLLLTNKTTSEKPECLAGFSGECNDQLLCSSEAYLKCNSGRCTCLSPVDQSHDTSTGRCYSKIGGRCTPNVFPGDLDVLRCGENAICNSTATNGDLEEYGRCECGAGYAEANSTMHCILSTPPSGAMMNQVSTLVFAISIVVYLYHF